MTAADMDRLLDGARAFDLEARRRSERRERETVRPPAFATPDEHRALHREHELAIARMRASRSAEGRTFYRLEVLRLEREMRAKGAA